MHEVFGFGETRLRKFYESYETECKKLRDWYSMSEEDMPYLTVKKLKEIGVDLAAWDNERP